MLSGRTTTIPEEERCDVTSCDVVKTVCLPRLEDLSQCALAHAGLSILTTLRFLQIALGLGDRLPILHGHSLNPGGALDLGKSSEKKNGCVEKVKVEQAAH